MDMDQATVYFIDDESQVLGALRRALRSRLKGWGMVFESSPKRALELMSEKAPWVVIVDKKMFEMDGVEFLMKVRASYPDSVRVILSGDIGHDTVVEAAGVAHLLLTKPFELDEIVSVVERAVCLRSFNLSEEVRSEIGKVDNLPILPLHYEALTAYLDSVEEPDSARVAELISHDMAVLSKILQLANSAYFCAITPVYSAHDAVIRLGYDLLKKLVLCFGIHSNKGDLSLHSNILRQSERVADKCLQLANYSGLSKADCERAYFLGLLHNVGELVIINGGPNLSYDLVGSFLLKLWGFEKALVDAIQYQSVPEKYQEKGVLLYQLNIAKTLVEADKNNILSETIVSELGDELIERALLSNYFRSVL